MCNAAGAWDGAARPHSAGLQVNSIIEFANLLLGGLAAGMVLYLVSVGLSVTMGLMGFVNLAHGVFAAAGGYVMTTLMTQWGIDFPWALLAGVIVVALGSMVLERILYR